MCAIDDGGEFGCTNAKIYPKKLELKPEHQNTYVSVVNLDINIVNGKFVCKLYDRRDSLPFFIAKMT